LTACPDNIIQTNDEGECNGIVLFDAPTALDIQYTEDFEHPDFEANPVVGNTNTQGWTEYSSAINVVSSGTNGINSPSGSNHAIFDATNSSTSSTGTFSRLGGYSTSFGEGFTGSIKVFIDLNDPAVAANTYGWDATLAASRQNGAHLRDFIFHAATNGTGDVVISGSNNTSGSPQISGDSYSITTSGWYTFEWDFRDAGDGSLAVDLKLLDNSGTLLFTETRNNPGDDIATTVGGNRYLWFTFLNVDNLAVDDVQLYRQVAVNCTAQSDDTFMVGNTNVICTTTDACGNTTNCDFDITINDIELPVASCQDITVQLDENGSASIVAGDID